MLHAKQEEEEDEIIEREKERKNFVTNFSNSKYLLQI